VTLGPFAPRTITI